MAKYVIGSAWPYVQTVPHLGNLIGSVLSADVYARYLRFRGHDVVFVSGSDMHGTPIEVEAIQLGVDPEEYAKKMHQIVAELFKRWDISFDLYTHTHSDTHIKFVQNFFLKIYNNGYIFTKEEEVPYCPRDKIYLPDRFIIGKCPYCGYERARGDQCENCGRLLDPKQLIEPRCAICGSRPEWRITKHWYLDLRKLEDRIRKYVEENPHLPPNAKEMSLGMLKEGLKPRAITRDNKWGIPAPFPGAEGKTIYVWFEAVLGYISAVVELFREDAGKWERYWKDPETKIVFFVGKDNIPFHVIILPALLLANGEGYTLPTTTASTEYLLYEGDKFSKSRRWGIWIDEALQLMPPDYWRFILIYIRPENRDTSFTWALALEIINKIMNDDVGNYINRVLTFIKNRMGGVVPPPGAPTREDEEFINRVIQLFKKAEKHYDAIELKDALHTVVEIAREGNRYLNARAPWELLRRDIEVANAVMYRAYWSLKTIAAGLTPVTPRSAAELWKMLGISQPSWDEAYKPPTPGTPLGDVRPLFRKFTEEEVKDMLKKLEELRSQRASKKYPWEQVLL
ncbi:methionyl-tRNA synthetase [Pyrobaculum islandicum DSM 4184]|uniref:Methionine--tRNA ligase n=1 Tax=Pyrobaculum islandicum (strain DSM 4184 / JCM 9189 / GEO3) TaxID=384616 RepID=SYM_PYRIL|nr:methionine--tRNA ligase [Pyrobaculum islandicum]A1RRE2.1 RecName: Full=Methionine--tRNA ligase; AltName: Full=Methionyl-tRNA synthetase; Short=MetRS [Pyrobaculum islandicum DSM 4184]ABL87524.1 methionyl-tRNA synthetase [Pyrobaculum islandicum DSM 4184]